MRKKTIKYIYRYVDLLYYNNVSCYMFRPLIVAIFREVFLEGCVTQNKSTYLYNALVVYFSLEMITFIWYC